MIEARASGTISVKDGGSRAIAFIEVERVLTVPQDAPKVARRSGRDHSVIGIQRDEMRQHLSATEWRCLKRGHHSTHNVPSIRVLRLLPPD